MQGARGWRRQSSPRKSRRKRRLPPGVHAVGSSSEPLLLARDLGVLLPLSAHPLRTPSVLLVLVLELKLLLL